VAQRREGGEPGGGQMGSGAPERWGLCRKKKKLISMVDPRTISPGIMDSRTDVPRNQ
jgi:hypothetical protein